jgi:hypothetical protein
MLFHSFAPIRDLDYVVRPVFANLGMLPFAWSTSSLGFFFSTSHDSSESIGNPLERGELASIPPSTDRLDQKHARIHLPSAKVDVITLVRESGCLGCDDL